MKVLLYLLFTTMKNNLKQLRKKPALLIFMILGCALLIMVFVISLVHTPNIDSTKLTDRRMLYSIIAGMGLLILGTSIYSGLSQGNTLFNMGDVGLLFVAPISPRKVLIYGMVKQLGITLFSGIFILFQVSTLKEAFGISVGALILLFIIYGIMIFFCQLISIAIFVYSNGNEQRKKKVMCILYIVSAILVVCVLVVYQQVKDIKQAVYLVVNAKAFELFPVIGWTVSFTKAIITQKTAGIIFSLVLYSLASGIIIFLFTKQESDFYESVLVCTEKRHQMKLDAKEGRIVNYKKKKKVEDKYTGLRHGKGASAIFYKHLTEMRRQSRIPFISQFAIISMIGAGIVCKIVDSEYCGYGIFGFLIYLKFILIAQVQLQHEIKKPLIFLIPDSSLKKLWYACLAGMITPCIEGILIFGVVFAFGKEAFLLCLFLAIAYALSGILFHTIPIFYQKIFGETPFRVLTFLLELFLLLMILMPGIVTSIIVSVSLSKDMAYVGTLPYSINCILVTVILFVVSRNVLQGSEL